MAIYNISITRHSMHNNLAYEGVTEKLTKCCQPLLFLMNLTGINVKFTKTTNCSSCIVIWLFRFLIFTIGIYMFAFQIFSLKNGLGTDDLWILCFNDHMVAWAFLYVICVRGNKIVKLVIKIIKLSVENNENDATFRQIRKVSLALSAISVLFVIYEPVFIYYHTKTNIFCDTIFKMGYFGIEAPPILRGLFAFISEIAHWYICLVAELCGAFFIFLIYNLGIGYQNINKSFAYLRNVNIEIVNAFQQQHYRLNTITNKFNQTFSPAILVYVCCIMGQVIGAPGNITTQIANLARAYNAVPHAPFTFFCHAILPTARAICILLLLFSMSNTVNQQSKEVFDRLLQSFLTHHEIQNCPHKDLILNCNKTALLSAQWSASPTAITASGLFTLNYRLIGVLISITITYWTLLGDLNGELAVSMTVNITCPL